MSARRITKEDRACGLCGVSDYETETHGDHRACTELAALKLVWKARTDALGLESPVPVRLIFSRQTLSTLKRLADASGERDTRTIALELSILPDRVTVKLPAAPTFTADLHVLRLEPM